MTDSASRDIVPSQQNIIIKSAGGWFNRLKVRINVTDVSDANQKIDPNVPNYKIDKEEWALTLGPVFNRVNEYFKENGNDRDDSYAIAVGYKNMRNTYDEQQTYSLHRLMQAFSAATQPGYIDGFQTIKQIDGTTRENPYGKTLHKFKNTWDNENAVLISSTQLKALANIAKGASDFAFKDMKKTKPYADEIKSFYESTIKSNPRISY